MSDVRKFLDENASGGHEKFNFDKVGDAIAGEIVGVPKMVNTRFGECLVLDVKPDNGEPRTVFVGDGPMARAVAQAVRDAGADDLAQGARIGIRFAETQPSKTAGFNDAKIYDVGYEPPRSSVSVDSIFDRARGS